MCMHECTWFYGPCTHVGSIAYDHARDRGRRTAWWGWKKVWERKHGRPNACMYCMYADALAYKGGCGKLGNTHLQIFLNKFLQTGICKNLDSQNISAIRYSRRSFSTLEHCASSDWQATSTNTYIDCFLVQHFLCVLQAQVETTGSYNNTTHQMTSLLPRLLHSMLKASEKLQSTS